MTRPGGVFDQRLRTWIADFVTAESAGSAVDAWVAQVLGRIVEQVPEVREDAALREVIGEACDAHWRAFLANLGQPEQTFHLVQEAREVPLVVAQHGHSLTAVFQIYNAGEQAVWSYITAAVRGLAIEGVSEAEALVHFWSRSSTWFDASVEASVVIFQEELDRIRQGDAARRLEVVRAVLDGGSNDARDVSASLGGHPLSVHQTAVLLRTDDDAAIADLPRAAHELATALGVRHPLIVHPGGRDLWAWLATVDVPDLAALKDCADWLAQRHMVATVGVPAPGIDGFRSSYDEAQATQHLQLPRGAQAPITYFTDVELTALVGDTESMRRFVHRTLGALAAADEQVSRLRETVRVLLASGSVDAAARALSVHKNTVRYRIDRAEELMGRRVSEDPTRIDVALRCHEAFVVRGGTSPA